MEPNEVEIWRCGTATKKRASGEPAEVARVLLYKWLATVRMQSASFGLCCVPKHKRYCSAVVMEEEALKYTDKDSRQGTGGHRALLPLIPPQVASTDSLRPGRSMLRWQSACCLSATSRWHCDTLKTNPEVVPAAGPACFWPVARTGLHGHDRTRSRDILCVNNCYFLGLEYVKCVHERLNRTNSSPSPLPLRELECTIAGNLSRVDKTNVALNVLFLL